MLNASWPRLFWQLYDYYLTPTSAFFGTLKACAPLNIIYNYGDGNIYVSNELGTSQKRLSAVIKVYDANSKPVFSQSIPFEINDFSAKKILDMPRLESVGPVYFVDLTITDEQGVVKANNFYWLSQKKDVIDETKTDWIYTPNKTYADFSQLKQLPQTEVERKTHFTDMGENMKFSVELTNPSNTVAFFISVKVKGKTSGSMVLPVLWNDNYISLIPGTSRTLEATIAKADLHGEEPVVEIKGWNVKGQ
jgi:exo-1,4-beta-D-glucosaminidase